MSKLKRDLKEAPLPDKTTRGDQIITACTGNAALGTLTAPLAAFVTANANLNGRLDDVAAASAAVTTAVVVQNETSAAWNTAFEVLVSAIESNTGGDQAKLDTTTIATYEPGHAPALGTPAKVENVAVTTGDLPEEQEVTWNGNQPRPKLYLVLMCQEPYNPANLVQVGMPSGSRFVKSGQTPGVKYWFVVVAVGSGGVQGPPSDPATGMAV